MQQLTRKIKVVHVVQYLEIGGLESFVVELCRNMDRARFEPRVLCLNGYDERYRRMLEESGVPLHLVTKRGKFDAGFFLRGASWLREGEVDVVHAHGGCFFYAAVMARLAGVRDLYYTAHGLPVRSGLKEDLEELASFFLARKVIAVSAEVAEDFRRRVKGCTEKVEVIINGVDTERFREQDGAAVAGKRIRHGIPADGIVVGAVGRLEPVKNYSLLLRSFAELARSSSRKVHLVLVGSGSEEESLRALAEELGVKGAVSFLGMRYDLPELYPLFDIFVLSSLTEGTSLSLLEAQSCGVPAVVTDVGGNGTVVAHGVNGYLCPSGDRASMTELLARLAEEEALRLNMRRAARRTAVERFSLQSMMQRYQALYHSPVSPLPSPCSG